MNIDRLNHALKNVRAALNEFVGKKKDHAQLDQDFNCIKETLEQMISADKPENKEVKSVVKSKKTRAK